MRPLVAAGLVLVMSLDVDLCRAGVISVEDVVSSRRLRLRFEPSGGVLRDGDDIVRGTVNRAHLESLKAQLATLASGARNAWRKWRTSNVEFEVALNCGDDMWIIESSETFEDRSRFCAAAPFIEQVQCRVAAKLEAVRESRRHANVRDFVKRVEALRE